VVYYRVAQPKKEGGSAAHDALIAKLTPKPKKKKEETAPAPAVSFSVGDKVTINGLTGAAQHNGKNGTVRGTARYSFALKLLAGAWGTRVA
jgi:hypothetical protein